MDNNSADKAKIKLAIIGVGLIGGSLGLCLKDSLGEEIYITGLCRTEKSMREAMRFGAVDYASADIAGVVSDADIVFLSPPVLQIVPMVKELLQYLKSGAIITDAGSTKAYIAEKLREILPADIYYIAGHPMTGREKSGVAAAVKDLFVNKAYVIIEDERVPTEVHERLMNILRYTGANFTTLSLDLHDRCAAVISHAPHVAAAALVKLLNRAGEDKESCLKLIGGGFKDTTRIASSNAEMWADICLTNAEPIVSTLTEMQNILDEVKDAIKKGDRESLHAYFAESKKCRDAILQDIEQKFDAN